MKKLNLLLLAFLVVMGVTLQSCDDSDGYSLGDVAVDWATVNVKGAHVYDFTGDRWGQTTGSSIGEADTSGHSYSNR